MAVNIGTVDTFADVEPDKAQAVKVLEESAEVFAAWQIWNDALENYEYFALLEECADLVQALANLLAALGVDDLRHELKQCKTKNVKRGREYEQ